MQAPQIDPWAGDGRFQCAVTRKMGIRRPASQRGGDPTLCSAVRTISLGVPCGRWSIYCADVIPQSAWAGSWGRGRWTGVKPEWWPLQWTRPSHTFASSFWTGKPLSLEICQHSRETVNCLNRNREGEFIFKRAVFHPPSLRIFFENTASCASFQILVQCDCRVYKWKSPHYRPICTDVCVERFSKAYGRLITLIILKCRWRKKMHLPLPKVMDGNRLVWGRLVSRQGARGGKMDSTHPRASPSPSHEQLAKLTKLESSSF